MRKYVTQFDSLDVLKENKFQFAHISCYHVVFCFFFVNKKKSACCKQISLFAKISAFVLTYGVKKRNERKSQAQIINEMDAYNKKKYVFICWCVLFKKAALAFNIRHSCRCRRVRIEFHLMA